MIEGQGAGGDLVPGAMTEYLTDEWGFFIRSARELERFRSPYQAVEVHDSVAFGRLFRLDGHFMTSERDEFFYHESLVHMPGLTHPAPERALVVGGGDGGSAEELLKYPTMKSVTLCEIDLAVVDVARKHLGSVHRGALDDPRLDLRIGDGFAFVRESAERYDLLILDLTDPGGPSTLLYTPEFYRACAARLAPGGAMTLHVASPVAHPGRIRDGMAALRAAFPLVTPYLASIPLYGGMWMMACASHTLDPRTIAAREVDRRIAQRGLADLRLYNGDVHRAALALPNFVRDLVGPPR
ncbi:MAG: polyamine aminopropyltransferase [Betaproteobacteria bacterium]|nr:polyamine aminopropyltransferase [Betaproteobacteria bacterium]MDH5288091.1 polyamine aminopropyltransferase [Betaproteobacteria bacterium]